MRRSSQTSVGRVVVIVLDVLSIVGCARVSSDSDAQSSAPGVSGTSAAASAGTSASGGTAGAATAGAATSGVSGASGSAGSPSGSAVPPGLLLGDSPTEVCIAYTVAECLRRSECAGHPSTIQVCLSSAAGCPDALFSDGSTLTASGSKACASEFATYSCAKLNVGFLPDCATAGTLANRQVCAFSSQCASLTCDHLPGQCGMCAALGELGARCSEGPDAEPGLACKPGLTCDRTHCVTYTGPNDPQFAEGTACFSESDCNAGLYCGPGLLCTKQPTLGMDCAASRKCGDGSYCNEARVCVAPEPPGASCQRVGQCQAGLSCACNDGTTRDNCARSCMATSLANEPCGVGAGATCHPGFECTAGSCQPRASLRLYDIVCSG